MLQSLTACLSVFSTVMLAALIIFLYKFKRSMPDVEQILVDVGESIGEQLSGIFEKPVVKASMTQLGKKSGEARADNALRKRVAGQAMDQIPGIGLILKQFDLTPIEGLKLLNDPLIGPLIQRGIAAAQKGIAGLSSGIGSGSSPGGTGGSFKGYGREE